MTAAASFCQECGRSLAVKHRRKTSLCQRCATRLVVNSPERRERMSRSMRARFQDPEFADLHRSRTHAGLLRSLDANPELRELRREQGRRLGRQFGGGDPAGTEGRKRTGFKLSQARLGWCPLEYREAYQRLRRDHGRAEARRMIELQIAADSLKYQKTGRLPVTGEKP